MALARNGHQQHGKGVPVQTPHFDSLRHTVIAALSVKHVHTLALHPPPSCTRPHLCQQLPLNVSTKGVRVKGETVVSVILEECM
jgi:hypothetical protein